jgi:hypothetical protein
MFVLFFSLVTFLVGWLPLVLVFGVLGLVLISPLVFVVSNVGLARVEHMRSPAVCDHLRHRTILYVGLVPLELLLVTGYDGRYCCDLQWTLGASLFPAATCAIVPNA